MLSPSPRCEDDGARRVPPLTLRPRTGTSPSRNREASRRRLHQHGEKQHVPRDSHPIWEFAVSSQLNHLIIYFVFKGRQELIHYKGLFCLQIATLQAPRAQIALITRNWSLFQLCLQAGGVSLDSRAAVQHTSNVLCFVQPSPDLLLGGREETVLKNLRSPQGRGALQGAHAASTSIRLFIYRLSTKSKILDVSPCSGKHVTASTQNVSEGLCRTPLLR